MKEERKLKKEIEVRFKDTRVIIPREKRLIITTGQETVLDLLRFFKDKGLQHLSAISCVDWMKKGQFELIYQISSHQEGIHIMLKTKISRKNPKLMTVISLFKNAQTYEREIWEMFGIEFNGNPRLIPLFLDNWKEIPPFRKDFDTRKYVEETFEPIPVLGKKQK